MSRIGRNIADVVVHHSHALCRREWWLRSHLPYYAISDGQYTMARRLSDLADLSTENSVRKPSIEALPIKLVCPL